MTNLIELFKNTLSDSITRYASGMLGESTESTASAVSNIVPALLAAMMRKGNSDAGTQELLSFMSANGIGENILNDLPFRLSGGAATDSLKTMGAGVLQFLVGDKLSSLVDHISSGSGLKTSSASSLLKIVSPLLLGTVAREVKEKNLDSSDLKDLLVAQSEFVKQSIPAGLSDLLGFSTLGAEEKIAHGSLEGSYSAPSDKEGSTMSKLLPWIALLIAALGLFYFLDKGSNSPASPSDTLSTSTPTSPDSANAMTQDLKKKSDSISESPIVTTSGNPETANPNGSGNLKTYVLPNGSKLIVESDKFTSLMIEYLNGNEPAGRCFPFDEVFFNPGTENLTADSRQQIAHLILLFNAYPKMSVMLTGHTDNAGDDQKNLKSSEAMAQALLNWLVREGIPSSRIQTKGMGEAKPITSNNTAAGRAKNRRVEVCVIRK